MSSKLFISIKEKSFAAMKWVAFVRLSLTTHKHKIYGKLNLVNSNENHLF